MTKPVGYYTNYTPLDGSLLDEIVNHFGSQLEHMTVSEKCWLIYRIGYHLWFHDVDGDGVSDEVETALHRCEAELPIWDKLGLIEALVSQLKPMVKELNS